MKTNPAPMKRSRRLLKNIRSESMPKRSTKTSGSSTNKLLKMPDAFRSYAHNFGSFENPEAISLSLYGTPDSECLLFVNEVLKLLRSGQVDIQITTRRQPKESLNELNHLLQRLAHDSLIQSLTHAKPAPTSER